MTKPKARRTYPLTPEAIESLPRPRKGWKYHRDPGAAHLFIGVGKTERKWIWYGKVSGAPKRFPVGSYPGMTPERARVRAADITQEHSEGKGTADLSAIAKQDMLLSTLFEDFVKNRRSKKGRPLAAYTRKLYRHWFSKHMKEWHARPIGALKRRDVAALHEKIGRQSPTSANRSVTVIRSVYDFAIEKGYYRDENPAHKAVTMFEENERDRFLEGDEMARFLVALGGEPNPDMRDCILLLLMTGARKANVLSMAWNDIALDDPHGARWVIPAAISKSRKKMVIGLVPQVVQILRSRNPQESGFVFPSTESASGHLASLESGWERIKKSAKLKDIRLHDLRRSLGSWQARMGASLLVIGRSLGQSDPRSTLIYARLGSDPARDSVGRAVNAMLKTLEPEAPPKRLRAPRRLKLVKGRWT